MPTNNKNTINNNYNLNISQINQVIPVNRRRNRTYNARSISPLHRYTNTLHVKNWSERGSGPAAVMRCPKSRKKQVLRCLVHRQFQRLLARNVYWAEKDTYFDNYRLSAKMATVPGLSTARLARFSFFAISFRNPFFVNTVFAYLCCDGVLAQRYTAHNNLHHKPTHQSINSFLILYSII